MAKHNTDSSWQQWGSQDPYYGVLSQPDYRRQNLEQNRERFFETGNQYVASLLDSLNRLYPGFQSTTAVDFGCGVGRLVVPLARHFQRVVGVDVSPDMLAEARSNCANFKVANAEFVSSDDLLSLVPRDVQLVHSLIVFQHIPLKRGLKIISNLISRLAPGGVAALHVPIEDGRTGLRRAVYFAKHRVPGARYAFNLLQRKRLNEPLMQMNRYPLSAISRLYQQAGLTDIWLQPVWVEPLGAICWGHKPGSPPR